MDHLEPIQQRGGVGVLLGRLDRPLDVVQHRQQVAQQRQVGVAELFFEFAGGPFAVVVQFGVAAELAVLGGLSARLRSCAQASSAAVPSAAFGRRAPPRRGLSPPRLPPVRLLRLCCDLVRGFGRAWSRSEQLLQFLKEALSRRAHVGVLDFGQTAGARPRARGPASSGTSTWTCTSRSPRPR